MSVRTPLLLLLLFAVLPACGRAPPAPSTANREAAARAASRKEMADRARAEISKASDLAAKGEVEAAWAAWRVARDLTGDTPDLARVADAIRKVETKQKEETAWKALQLVLSTDTRTMKEEERLTLLARTVADAKAFLETYPQTKYREETEAGLEYAEREISIQRLYADALAEARAHLAAERWREAAVSAQKALDVLKRDEAAEILNQALRALTPEGMVFIPGGAFLSGRNRERAWLPPFYIDRTEVTCARYSEFVKATGHDPPIRFAGKDPFPGEEERPVSGLTLADALAYAAWAQKRLPTEVEWERAARGRDGRNYPWGDEWDPGKGHFGAGGALPVGSKPLDVSPDGALDMGGNVMEMTLPVGDPEGRSTGPIMKGGHWADDLHPEYALTFERYPVGRDHSDSGSGFRCAKAAP